MEREAKWIYNESKRQTRKRRISTSLTLIADAMHRKADTREESQCGPREETGGKDTQLRIFPDLCVFSRLLTLSTVEPVDGKGASPGAHRKELRRGIRLHIDIITTI